MKRYECKGQLSIFDVEIPKPKPCQYGFARYVGQKVVLHVTSGTMVGTVKEIEPYYTIVDVEGKEWVGTPTTLGEFKPEPKAIHQWLRLSRHTPPEDPDKVIKVMYTWMNGKRTGECAATYEDGKINFIGIPWDIGKVEPEAWKETDYTREEYREKYGR